MLRHASRPFAQHSLRTYSTQPQNVPVKLIAELRKQTTVSLTKAREALLASNNDIPAALAWLAEDISITGAKKAAKLADRSAKEGLVTLALMHANAGRGVKDMGVRAALVELNCETDFVARNELFGQLADDIAHSVAFHAEQSRSAGSAFIQPSVVESLLEAPLMPANQASADLGNATVGSAIRDHIAKLGENISLRRALSVVAAPPPSSTDMRLRLASYIHNAASKPTQGRIAGLALLGLKSKSLATQFDEEAWLPKLERLERALIRQVVGYETTSVSGDEETALYKQAFVMFPDAEGATVKEALAKWSKEQGLVENPEEGGIAVLEYAKWSVGETI